MNRNKKFETYDIVIMGILAGITAILAQVAIPLPFSPVPISLGVIGVYSCGILQKPKYALLSQIVYLAIGAIGVPVFGGFQGGISILVGPTGGYLMMYPLVAYLVSIFINNRSIKNKDKLIRIQIFGSLGMSLALTFLYLVGSAWLGYSIKVTFREALLMGTVPFIGVDIIKIVFTTMTIIPIRNKLLKMGLVKFTYKENATLF